ncbi:conserved threonine rich protein [Aspergillus terreus]|uniref:Conserved threonine rich protein n=1 Tax=Aspergillus terreus TaxID=33178 RepID=A0A5M3Z4E9_ASPTE|nr:hypothetical protein ATETN484_0009026000 [Aspergillus terreus]GFF17711.1 conserved threonine rich protein [Aspergillus terreus]
MHFNVASIVAFAASAMALTVTSPAQGDKVDFSKPVDIKWRSVESVDLHPNASAQETPTDQTRSDPKNITLELVNMNGQPNVNKQIADGVKASEGHYKVDKLWGIPVAEGYQINIISNEERNTGILAQSQQFNVTRVADPPKTSKRDSIHSPTTTTITKTAYTSATQPSRSCSCSYRSRLIKPSARPCVKHYSSAPPSSTVPSASTSTGESYRGCVESPVSLTRHDSAAATSARASATETAPAATSSTAGSASLAVPAAGSLAMGLLALIV